MVVQGTAWPVKTVLIHSLGHRISGAARHGCGAGFAPLGFAIPIVCNADHSAAHMPCPAEPSAALLCYRVTMLSVPLDQCAAFHPDQAGVNQQRRQSGCETDMELLPELCSALCSHRPAL